VWVSHFITEAALFHYANEALHAGISRHELAQLVGSDIFTKKPSITTKVYIEKAHPLLRILHDTGYQKRRELTIASNLFAEHDIHSAYFDNAPDLHTFINWFTDMCQRQTSSIDFNMQSNAGTTTLQINFMDNKSDFYSPQSFHVMFIMLARRIFELTPSQSDKFCSGFTQVQLPDEDNFSRFATTRIKTNENKHYIQFPSSFLEIKNQHFNPLITGYLTHQYNQHYGQSNHEDKLLTTISAHLSASWAQGNIATNIDNIAEKLGMSRSKLYRELTQRNVTFSSIVESQRKKYAMIHIKNRNTSIAEISDRLGYANVSAFTRAFNRWFNTNPSKMRQ
jgi:AraC-like DNA-binding protein